MENRNSLIDLLEDLTTGKGYEPPKKSVRSENPRASQNIKPKVFEYDHKFNITKSKDYNHQSVASKPNDHVGNFPSHKLNTAYYVLNKSYPPPSWPQNYGPTSFQNQSELPCSSSNIVGFGLYNQAQVPLTIGYSHVQSPSNAISTDSHLDQTLNPMPFRPNSDKITMPSPVPFSPSFNTGLQFPHFDHNKVRPTYSSDTQSGLCNNLKVNCNKPISATPKYFKPYNEYTNKSNASYSFHNVNSPGMIYKEDPNITHAQNSFLKLNLLPPPSPPILLKNYKSKNSSEISKNSISNTITSHPVRGPRTPPMMNCGNSSSSERIYSSVKGPRTPPMKGKGPSTPPQKGPRTPPLKGPHTPPLTSPIPFKGPHTPPLTSPYAPPSWSPSLDSSMPQMHPPLPPSPIAEKPPLPSSIPIIQDYKLKTPEPHKIQGRKIKMIRRRSQEISSSDSDSSDKPDTCYPDYKRNILDSPESFQLSEYCDSFRKDIALVDSVDSRNLQGSYDPLLEEPAFPIRKDVGCCYFYGSSFFEKGSTGVSCSDPDSKSATTNIKKMKQKGKVNLEKKYMKSGKHIKDELKQINSCILGRAEESDADVNPQNNFLALQCSDTSDDLNSSSTDKSLCTENLHSSDSEVDNSPFIKYTDYEELLNLETKRLTMEQELSQGDIETELNVADKNCTLVEQLENGSPILYDLPDDSPPPLSPLAHIPSVPSPVSHPMEELGKPKYPRYFKDKVAFTSNILPPFNDIQLHSPEQNYSAKKDSQDALPHKELLPRFNEMQNNNTNIISIKSIKVAKTPLIKRLGLIEDSSLNTVAEQIVKKTPAIQSQMQIRIETPITDHHDQSSLTPLTMESTQSIKVDKETPKPIRKLVIVENKQGKLTTVKLTSPTYPEKTIPAKVKQRDNKEFSQTSFKNKENKLLTPKGRGHTQKSYEKRYVKESPIRLDLDSRIKILFGTKNDSSQKFNNIDSPPKYHYKNYPPLQRPPSPFCNRNLYLYWHRETYYFRKHNPIPPPGSVDPMLRRKIGIQITHQSSHPLKNDTTATINTNLEVEEKNYELDQLETLVELSLSPKLCQLNISNVVDTTLPELTSDRLKINNSGCDQFAITVKNELVDNEKNNSVLPSTEVSLANEKMLKDLHSTDSCLMPAAITRIDVPPNNELELVSEPAEIDISVSNAQSQDNPEKIPEEMIEMVMAKIIDDFKNSLKRHLTDSLVNDDLLDDFRPFKVSKSE